LAGMAPQSPGKPYPRLLAQLTFPQSPFPLSRLSTPFFIASPFYTTTPIPSNTSNTPIPSDTSTLTPSNTPMCYDAQQPSGFRPSFFSQPGGIRPGFFSTLDNTCYDAQQPGGIRPGFSSISTSQPGLVKAYDIPLPSRRVASTALFPTEASAPALSDRITVVDTIDTALLRGCS
jgi:hypothetical protein